MLPQLKKAQVCIKGLCLFTQKRLQVFLNKVHLNTVAHYYSSVSEEYPVLLPVGKGSVIVAVGNERVVTIIDDHNLCFLYLENIFTDPFIGIFSIAFVRSSFLRPGASLGDLSNILLLV
jgi:hypothetical protein